MTQAEILDRLTRLPGWRVEGTFLEREYRFDSYASALSFVNQVAALAEDRDHHPDLLLSWKRVVARLTSHDAGGITQRDFGLAAAIDALPPRGREPR